jgi:colanic acid/amylovoran biosynthesis glycosyltransferase|tara:strand:- start:104 stop:1264 length:1161 start_codon:yes stop_codon:yes gene_type:complete
MKIGLVLSSTPAYSETFFNSKIKGLQKNGFEVVLFVNSKDTHFDLCTVKEQVQFRSFFIFLKSLGLILTKLSTLLKFISLERKQNVSFKRILKKLILNQHILQESNVDWLHFGFATQAIGRENIAKAIGAKMAVSLRGFDIGIYPLKNPKCYDLLWLNINKLHVISNDLLNLAYANGFKKNVPYQKITPAIDTSFFINQSLKDASNKNLLQLMTIGRLHWKKDYTSIIIALKNLKDRGIDFEYTIIGDGPEEEKLKYLVYELGLINNIIFTGKISQKEILIYFKKSHFYLQYSLQEGFCNAVLEAQSMGVLPIVSNAEGLSENVLNNITGWVIQKNSPKLLADKIVEVINLPDGNKEKIRKQAIERIKKEFNIEKQQKEFIDFYTQ